MKCRLEKDSFRKSKRICKGPGLSGNLVKTGENAKQERQQEGEGKVEGGQGSSGQGSTGYSKDSIFVLRKTGINGRTLSKGVASNLPFQSITQAAGWGRDGWVGSRWMQGSVGNLLPCPCLGTRRWWSRREDDGTGETWDLGRTGAWA